MRSRTRKAPASPCDAWAINPPIGELLRDPKDHCLGSRSPRGGFPPAPEPPSMEGRTTVRPDRSVVNCFAAVSSYLQWRTGQSSGQTWRAESVALRLLRPSMEGRTIVRPDLLKEAATLGIKYNLQWRAGKSSGQTWTLTPRGKKGGVPSMEGRTIVRPDLLKRSKQWDQHQPSMEGRTIVRPDMVWGWASSTGGCDRVQCRCVGLSSSCGVCGACG